MSPYIMMGWLLALAAVAAVGELLRRKHLVWDRDWFLLLFYGQSLVYLNLTPMLFLSAPPPVPWSGTPDENTELLYVFISAEALLFFQLPLLFIYLKRVVASLPKGSKRKALIPVQRTAVILGLVGIAFGALFIYVMLSNDLFTAIRTYQNAGLPSIYGALPTPVYIVMRLFQMAGLFLSGVLLLIMLNGQNLSTTARKIVSTAFVIVLGTWLVFYLLNGSRSFMVIAVLLILGVAVSQSKNQKRVRTKRMRTIAFVAVLASLYLLKIAYSIRFSDESVPAWAIVSPGDISFLKEMPTEGVLDFRYRLNGIDSMAMITPQAFEQGFAYGEAWLPLIFVSVAQVVDRGSVAALKLDRSTDPKMNLIYRYTQHSEMIDWPNSILFDLYGNFWIFGMMLAGWVFAEMFAFAAKALAAQLTLNAALIGLYCVTSTMQFESTFLAWALLLVNGAPVLWVVTRLKLFRFESAQQR
jgi:hypothetical protein